MITHVLRKLDNGKEKKFDPNNTIEILDEGPFPDEGEIFRKAPPSMGRQRVVSMLSKTNEDGSPVFELISDESKVFPLAARGLAPIEKSSTKPAPVASDEKGGA